MSSTYKAKHRRSRISAMLTMAWSGLGAASLFAGGAAAAGANGRPFKVTPVRGGGGRHFEVVANQSPAAAGFDTKPRGTGTGILHRRWRPGDARMVSQAVGIDGAYTNHHRAGQGALVELMRQHDVF